LKHIWFVSVAVIGIFLLFLLNSFYNHMWQEQRDRELANQAELIQTRLENALQLRVDTTQYLKSLFQLHPDTSAQEFEKFAQSLMEHNPSLRALQFADQSTQVVFVYPPKGNKITITEPMVLINDPLRGKFVKKAIENREMAIQPPFELRQGGLGIIARNPIFISDRFIGMAIAVLDVPVIIDEGFPHEESSIFQFSLTDSEGNTFYHGLPEGIKIEKRTISFANAKWILKIAHKLGETDTQFIDRFLILGLGGLALVFLLALIWFLNHRAERLKKMVTERTRELEESENLFRIVADYTVDWEYWVSPEGTVLYNSPSCENVTGYYRKEIQISNDILKLVHPNDVATFSEHILDEEKEGSRNIEFRIITKNGKEKWIGHFCQPIYDENGILLGSRASNRDITSQKLLNKKLEEAIEEKDFLMSELNHRVKNNLMMVNSLIKLKNDNLGNEIDLSDISHQIDTIRIVHEKLYKNMVITHINFREYVEELLSAVFSFTDRVVQVENNIEAKEISTKQTIPLGLIINEFATNAIKHGFNDKEKAVFSVKMKKDTDVYVITLSNSGNPFPEDIEFDNSDTLGLRLIKVLTTQINGTIDLQKKPHPVFTIRFPLGEE